jgi:hypothetical protein
MGPVSSTGRAMMASLNGAMRQGMPIDQAIAYVKSMAKDGVAPLVDLYAMLNQYQRLQQQQVKPPQTPPTIRDQIMGQAQQIPMQQPVQGIMQQSPMQQGLGGLNTGVMENAQYAGGGIVAFEGGGGVQSFQTGGATWEMNLIRQLRAQGLSLEEINRVVAEERAKRDVALGKTAEDRMPYETERRQAEKARELDLEQARKIREREFAEARAQQEARLGGGREASAVKPEAPKRGWATPDVDAPKGFWRGLRGLGRTGARAAGPVVGGVIAAQDIANISDLSDEELRKYYGYEGEGSTLGNWGLRGRAFFEEQIMPLMGPVLAAGLGVPSLAMSETRTPVQEIMEDRQREREAELQEVEVTTQKLGMPAPVKRAETKLPASRAMSFIDSAIENLQKEGPDALTAEQSAEVAKRLADLPAQRRRDTYLALSQAGFSMAEAASKPGAKFLGALGAGGKEASRLLTMLNKDLRDVENDLRKEMFAIEREGARITRDRENRIMDLNLTKQKMQEDRDALAARLGVQREEIGSRERLTTATTEATAAQREFSNRLQVDRLVQEQTSLLELQKQGQKDPEKRAEIQAQIDAIRNNIYSQYGIAPVAAVNPRTASPDQFGELKQVNTGG